MGLVCQSCGKADNDPSWEFCGACGADLTSAPAGQPPRKPPQENFSADFETRPRSAASAIAPASRAMLSMINQGKVQRTFNIEKNELTIGRWDPDVGAIPDIDLTEDDPGCYVSRHHCRIFSKESRFFVEDLGGKNPTRINKTNKLNPHAPYELKNGDEILVGKLFLRFNLT